MQPNKLASIPLKWSSSNSHYLMTSVQITRQRATDLRAFFMGRFGYGWQTRIRERLKRDRQLPRWFVHPETLTFLPVAAMERLESLAVKLGYKLGDLERPFETYERKSSPRKRRGIVCLNIAKSSATVLTVENHLAPGDLGPNSLESP